MKNYYSHGDHNAICDVCGRKFKGSQLRRRWDNAMVCLGDWEDRHPQDLIKPGRPSRPLRSQRPESTDFFFELPLPEQPVNPEIPVDPPDPDDSIGSTNKLIVNGVKGLQSVTLSSSAVYSLTGFYVDSAIGGGDFAYRSSVSKSTHDGGNYIAPEAIVAWDGTGASIAQLLTWTGSGNGVFARLDQSNNIEDYGASSAITINDVVINHMCQLAANQPLKTKPVGNYPVYNFSAPINFNNRSFDLAAITLKPINSFNAAPGTILVRTGTSTVSIRDSFHHRIKIDGNAGSISGGVSNAANQANAFIALNIYGDRSPKSTYFVDLTNCTKGILVDGDCECKSFEVHSSYVDYLIDEREADQSHWEIYGKYSGQVFKSDGQSSGYVFLMWEQTVALAAAPTTPCIDIAGGKSYSIGGELRAINTSVVINDSPTGGNGTGHINFDDLQIIQARTNLAMQIKNVDVVDGSFYLENYTVGGVVLDDIRCAAGLTMNLSDCRGGVPLTIDDLGTALGFNSKINVNISRSTSGTPSTNAIVLNNTYNCNLNVGQCAGNISVGSAVEAVHIDLDADFIRNSKTITVNNPIGYFSATIGGIIPISYLATRVAPWAFNGLKLESVYRGVDWLASMRWSSTGFVSDNALVSSTNQLSVENDLYGINSLFRVTGQAVYLANTQEVVYPGDTTSTGDWIDSAAAVVVTGISTTELKYSCDISGPVTYALATDRFTASRPSSGTSGQLIYTVPNGNYSVHVQTISGGTIAIRDSTTVLQTVAVGENETHTVAITAGELRINNQYYPYDTVFIVHSITAV